MMLGQDVAEWVRARRAEGLSWRKVSRLITDRTNGQITISHETLRTHYPDTHDDEDVDEHDRVRGRAKVRAG